MQMWIDTEDSEEREAGKLAANSFMALVADKPLSSFPQAGHTVTKASIISPHCGHLCISPSYIDFLLVLFVCSFTSVGVPQFAQNFVPSFICSPQLVQNAI